MTVHLILGGLCALFILLTRLQVPGGSGPADGTIVVVLASGFVGAFFYWMIAGRRAGSWMGDKPESDEPDSG